MTNCVRRERSGREGVKKDEEKEREEREAGKGTRVYL